MTTEPKPKPKYVQIAEYLRGEIDKGRLRPGDKVGNLLDLATRWNCAPETVRGAIAMLKIEGLVDPKHGLGVFVTEPEDRKPAMDRPSDSVPESVMMLIMRLAVERDEGIAAVIEKLDDLGRAVAELRLADDREEQYGLIQRQLDKINQRLATLPTA